MKKVFNSIGQVFQQIKKDPMMLAACFTPFLVGALIKFGIPLIEKAAKFSLQPYAVGFLPSFWAAKAVQNEAVLYFPMALAAALIWYYFLTKRLFQKLAG